MANRRPPLIFGDRTHLERWVQATADFNNSDAVSCAQVNVTDDVTVSNQFILICVNNSGCIIGLSITTSGDSCVTRNADDVNASTAIDGVAVEFFVCGVGCCAGCCECLDSDCVIAFSTIEDAVFNSEVVRDCVITSISINAVRPTSNSGDNVVITLAAIDRVFTD